MFYLMPFAQVMGSFQDWTKFNFNILFGPTQFLLKQYLHKKSRMNLARPLTQLILELVFRRHLFEYQVHWAC